MTMAVARHLEMVCPGQEMMCMSMMFGRLFLMPRTFQRQSQDLLLHSKAASCL